MTAGSRPTGFQYCSDNHKRTGNGSFSKGVSAGKHAACLAKSTKLTEVTNEVQPTNNKGRTDAYPSMLCHA